MIAAHAQAVVAGLEDSFNAPTDTADPSTRPSWVVGKSLVTGLNNARDLGCVVLTWRGERNG